MFFRKNKKNNIQNPTTSELNKSDKKINVQTSEIKSENKFVWCPGLPKSGTTLLEQILERLTFAFQNTYLIYKLKTLK